MADESKAVAIDAGVLASLLKKLDDVMAEAARLRDEVSRQIADQRSGQQLRVTATPARRKRPAPKR